TAEKQHIIEAFHFEVGAVTNKDIRQKVVDMFNKVDGQLAKEIAKGIGAKAPSTPGGTGVTDSSPAVSQENTHKCPKTRKVAILVENGFNFPELSQVQEALKAAGVSADIISQNLGMLTSVDGKQIEVTKNYHTGGSIMYDALYITGGRQCVDLLLTQGDAVHFVNEAFKHAKPIGATNEAVELLESSQIQGVKLAGKETVAQLCSDLGVVSIRNAADMGKYDQQGYFSQEFINAIAQHRHWGRQELKKMVPA
ncbi:MAG: DJ-1/PfpI family protein, partial [Bacillota bacterium]|nr:DJ-1/PfpI family protein [Bacillota bacterium]